MAVGAALTSPFGKGDSIDKSPGLLALVGSGEFLPPVEPVDRCLLDWLGDPPRVVCLPTAAGQEGRLRIEYWIELGVAHFRGLGAAVESLPVIDRRSACDPRWVERILQANFVYLSGGRPAYLYRTLHGAPVWDAIECVYRRGGVLAGCSAGAMIMGAQMAGFPRWRPGFGLLPGVAIAPHFDEISPRLVNLMRRFVPAGLSLVGIDGNTALVVDPEGCSVTGSGVVTVWKGRSPHRYHAGDSLAL